MAARTRTKLHAMMGEAARTLAATAEGDVVERARLQGKLGRLAAAIQARTPPLTRPPMAMM